MLKNSALRGFCFLLCLILCRFSENAYIFGSKFDSMKESEQVKTNAKGLIGRSLVMKESERIKAEIHFLRERLLIAEEAEMYCAGMNGREAIEVSINGITQIISDFECGFYFAKSADKFGEDETPTIYITYPTDSGDMTLFIPYKFLKDEAR